MTTTLKKKITNKKYNNGIFVRNRCTDNTSHPDTKRGDCWSTGIKTCCCWLPADAPSARSVIQYIRDRQQGWRNYVGSRISIHRIQGSLRFLVKNIT